MATSIIATIKKKNKNETVGTIYIRGYYNRKAVAAISTGIKIDIEHWDTTRREIKKNAPNAGMLNNILSGKLQAMKTQLMQKEIMGGNINRSQVSKAVKGINDSSDFLQFCTDQLMFYTRSESRRTYKSEISKLKQFRNEVSFSDIDYTFLTRYKDYMHKKLGNAHNTIWKSFKFINTMMNKAIKVGGIILENPLKNFDRGKYIHPDKHGLEIEDCNAIEALTCHPNETIRKVSIYFLLMAYSGMRFTDAMRFDPAAHILNGKLNMVYSKYNTQVNNKIHKRLQVIIDKVEQNRIAMSNREFNDHLKTIGGICNIAVDLTSHLGRHTMGGLLAELEVPEEQAQIVLGHRDIRSTRVYYHVKNKNIDRAMDRFNEL